MWWTRSGSDSCCQGVYEELLEIYQQVGTARAKYILDTLAFGF
jgi:hypothetical protein